MLNGLSVTELTRRIKSVLETDFSDVVVIGEISNYKRHSSGHVYFTLKDENASLSAVIWRGRNNYMTFTPQDGMKVIARGAIKVYEVRGSYQLDVANLKPLGIGELQIAFENLKKKLAAEGLFSNEVKKTLSEYPDRIGIVTSPTGAALQDILNILSRRFPALDVILYPVKVQGTGAAEEIAEAIRDLNKYGNIDVLIVGRGGGSIEDLWAFNEEIVARAIFDSKIPVVSAVGHEIDFTIADFVADLRAPTPSAAAELVVKDKNELIENLKNFKYTITQKLLNMISDSRDDIQGLISSYAFNSPIDLIRQNYQKIDEFDRVMQISIGFKYQSKHQMIKEFSSRLRSLNPVLVLKRGYSIIYRDDKIIDSADKLEIGNLIDIKFSDGKAEATVTNK